MLVKVLEHKWVIRIFGILLILAPFLNIAFTITQFKTMPDRWDIYSIQRIAASASTPFLILQLCSLVIGSMMLRGTTKAWRYVLVLVGGHIVLQLTQFQQFRGDRTPWVFLFIDIAVFVFIADQLVWKVKIPEFKRVPKPPKVVPEPATSSFELPALPSEVRATATAEQEIAKSEPFVAVAIEEVVPLAPTAEVAHLTEVLDVKFDPPAEPIVQPIVEKPKVSRPISLTSNERILIHLQGFGAWGQLLDVSSWGICVRAIVANPPANVTTKALEIGISKDVYLRLEFVRQNGRDYYFNYTNLTETEVTLLNEWLVKLAA